MKKFVIKTKRDFPSVEILSNIKEIVSASGDLPKPLVIETIRDSVEKLKNDLSEYSGGIKSDLLIDRIISEIQLFRLKKVGRVINGTGILVHTNLGRAPLSEELFNRIKGQITGYGNLEFDVSSGKRGRRGELAERYLSMISGSESGAIVNNNAAALFLILNSFANRRKVVISRSELVQIGGGFRIPDIIKRAGAKLIEIGTTNITSLKDYEESLEQKPAMILKVHRSNFALTGFTDEPDIKSLVKLGIKHGIPVVNDLGSGVLIDTLKIIGLKEPSVQMSVRDGAQITCFSGDKLLGGVQAGLIVGEKDYITRIKMNPLYRALRVDKIVFSALEELLGYYLNGSWVNKIKLWRLASLTEKDLISRGKAIIKLIGKTDKLSLEKSEGEMGGGSLPDVKIPSMAIVFHSQQNPQKIARCFREINPPIIGRISENRFLIDLRAIDNDEFELLASQIKTVIEKL